MKDYEKLLKVVVNLEVNAIDLGQKYEVNVLPILNDIRKVKEILEGYIVEQNAEMDSMIEEFKRINKMNKELGEIIRDSK